jgi:hypothetical protein
MGRWLAVVRYKAGLLQMLAVIIYGFGLARMVSDGMLYRYENMFLVLTFIVLCLFLLYALKPSDRNLSVSTGVCMLVGAIMQFVR